MAIAVADGRLMLVEYGEEPDTWHERLVIMRSTPEAMMRVTGVEAIAEQDVWWALTPDGDLYPQQLSVPPLRGVALLDAGHVVIPATVVPLGALARHQRRLFHRFQAGRAIPCASPLAYLEALETAKREEVPRLRLRAKAPNPRGALLPEWQEEEAPRATVITIGRHKLPPAGESHRWVVTRGHKGREIGDDADEDLSEWAVVDRLGLVVQKDGGSATVAALSPPDVEQLLKRAGGPNKAKTAEDEVELDARVLAIERLPDGRRHRAFRDAVTALTETSWENWPVHGPRTLLWCVRHILEHDQHPLAHRTRFKQNAGLQHHDSGVPVHESAMRTIEIALTYDQLQASELACLEIVVRQAQLVELKYRDKVLGNQTGRETTMLEQDDHLYLGTGRTRGLLMIDPKLEEYVAGELQREAAAAKERRKMREERGLQRPPPDPEGKGGGKKK